MGPRSPSSAQLHQMSAEAVGASIEDAGDLVVELAAYCLD